MKLGTRGRYAVMAMVDLANNSQVTPVVLSEIAERQGLPILYLEQLFVPLRRALYVKSVRGQKGGYVLNRPAHEIKILDIVQTVGELAKITRCTGSASPGCLPNQEKCLTHALWADLEQHLITYLAGVSLADVCTRRLPGLKAEHHV